MVGTSYLGSCNGHWSQTKQAEKIHVSCFIRLCMYVSLCDWYVFMHLHMHVCHCVSVTHIPHVLFMKNLSKISKSSVFFLQCPCHKPTIFGYHQSWKPPLITPICLKKYAQHQFGKPTPRNHDFYQSFLMKLKWFIIWIWLKMVDINSTTICGSSGVSTIWFGAKDFEPAIHGW